MVKFTTGPWGWNMAEDGVGTIYGGPIDAAGQSLTSGASR